MAPWLLWLLLVTGAGGSGDVPPVPRAVPEPRAGTGIPPGGYRDPPGRYRDPPGLVPGSPRAVSDAELRQLSEQLLAADSNRAGPGQLELNLKGSGSDTRGPRGGGRGLGGEGLFSYVSPELLARPTFSRLLALLDNYEPRTGRDEVETAEEQREQQEFLEAALDTPVLALLERFVLSKGLYPSAEAFRADLHSMWFGLYSRSSGKALDSSGFEHVFHVDGLPGRAVAAVPLGRVLQTPGVAPGGLQPRVRPWLCSPSASWHAPTASATSAWGVKPPTIQTYTWEKQRLVASAYPLTP
ncbi:uridylate-specific endoribonuclease C-like [Poecile atricapillus]|uniref:uridylate-specific endoribonuclease C-like n=1 Tax=Poecile atricapillus TaxID=48891 RepID=UPI002739F4E3|nr:uridylate-specific endoribonuclease C-like [Poecile atricapillus]